MSLSEASILRRLAAEIDAAGSACVVGLSGDALRPLLAAGTRLVDPSALAQGEVAALLVVAVTAVAETGACVPTLPRERWAAMAGLDPAVRRVAVVLPASPDEPAGAATGRALVRALEAHEGFELGVDRVITLDAVLDRDEAGFVIGELARGLSARQLQEQVEPSLRIDPTVAEWSERSTREPR